MITGEGGREGVDGRVISFYCTLPANGALVQIKCALCLPR